MFKKILFFIILLAVVVGGLVSNGAFNSKQVVIVTPTRGQAVEAVYATGTVEPVYWSKLSAPISGIVTEILKDEGEYVETNETIARLDDREPSAEIQRLRANASYLKSEMERQRALSKRNFSSMKEYERISAEYEAITASLQAASKMLSDTKIVSPLKGQVLRRLVELGEFVRQGDPICWVGVPEPLQVLAEVDEEDIPKVTLDQVAMVKADAFPDSPIMGAVTKIIPKGDPVSKIFLVEVSIPKDSRLKIGMTTEVNFITQEKENALLVPSAAVLKDKVWVAEGGVARARAVKLGIVGEKMTEILEGINDQDVVIAEHDEALQDGMRIRAMQGK